MANAGGRKGTRKISQEKDGIRKENVELKLRAATYQGSQPNIGIVLPSNEDALALNVNPVRSTKKNKKATTRDSEEGN